MTLMRGWSLFTLIFIQCFLVSHAVTPGGNEAKLAHQRTVFKSIEKLVNNPNSQKYKRLREQLIGYPLAPYIEQKTLKAYPYLANKEKITRFLTEFEGTPLDRSLRHKWLGYLQKKNRADLFVSFYKPTSNVELKCHYLSYRLASGAAPEGIF